MNSVIVELGSNIDPHKNIEKAREILRTTYTVIAESRFQDTKPVGDIRQANFINGAVLIETNLNSQQFKDSLTEIESNMGRKRSSVRFAPRVIDLDIVVWNDVIKDPNFYGRDYLKESVLELIPDLKH